MNYTGVIIEESLDDISVLQEVKILDTRIEEVTEQHQTPWLKRWTLHDVEIEEAQAESIAKKLSKDLESEHEWYADFKNDKTHYIIFRNKIFKVNRQNPEEYNEVTKYGISLGIPDYQVNFTNVKKEME